MHTEPVVEREHVVLLELQRRGWSDFETKEGEHPTVDKTAEGWEICEAGATPRIVSSCGGLAVAQSFSGAVATASGPFGSFRRYRTPMEALREDHPLWVGSSLGKKNATAARRDNDMLAGLGYETTSALPLASIPL